MNSEGPWVGGVFSRATHSAAPSLGAPTKSDFTVASQIKSNTQGYTNRVVVVLNPEDRALRGALAIVDPDSIAGKRATIEAAFVAGYNNVLYRDVINSALGGAFDGALRASYLLSSDRIAASNRVEGATDDALELLQRYIIVEFDSVEAAGNARSRLAKNTVVSEAVHDIALEYSSTPSDYYFAPPAGQLDSNYQWGMYAMNFPGSSGAWARSRGGGYVGVADALTWDNTTGAGLPGYNPNNFIHSNSDSNANFRKQLTFRTSGLPLGNAYSPHGRHVVGIIAAQASTSALGGGGTYGVAGGCPNCSLGVGATGSDVVSASALAEAITGLVQRGVQSINISMNAGVAGATCSYGPYVCTALSLAASRDVMVVVASGNYNEATPRFPANVSSVLPVGAIQLITPSGAATSSGNWQRLGFTGTDGVFFGGNGVPSVGVSAPGRNIISTFKASDDYNQYIKCGDTASSDGTSSPRTSFGDAFGTCSGTSMAAPHVTALASLMRSTSPLTSYTSIRSAILNSGHLAGSPSGDLGYGVPNARAALDSLTSASTGSSRLTPLFSMYSSVRSDYYYTTSPQMGAAAWSGTLEPRANTSFPTNNATTNGSYASVGTSLPYTNFPGTPYYAIAKAEAWIFSTPENPLSVTALAPLFRLSFACNHPASPVAQPATCSTTPEHMDSTYTTDSAGVSAYQSVGYLLDGIEGYIYPKTVPQPTGTVRLMRKYNAARDDHAIFPENLLSQYTAEGYTENSGSDWLGYVYPNYGSKPIIQ